MRSVQVAAMVSATKAQEEGRAAYRWRCCSMD